MRIPEEIAGRWQVRRDEWARFSVQVDGKALAEAVLADLALIAGEGGGDALTLREAAGESGYSPDHLSRLVREGRLPNVGRKHAPRVLRSDLPRRLKAKVANGKVDAYDAAADARSLRAVRR